MTESTNTVLDWEDTGIKIRVPAGVVVPGAVCDIAVIPLLHGDFLFPDYSVAVSGVYAVGTSCDILKPLTISMQHCADVSTEEDITTLTFCKAEHNDCRPPYQFIPCVDSGSFVAESRYGDLDCQSFTSIAIIRRMQYWITGRYPASLSQVLYSRSPEKTVAYIFVVKNINSIINVS